MKTIREFREELGEIFGLFGSKKDSFNPYNKHPKSPSREMTECEKFSKIVDSVDSFVKKQTQSAQSLRDKKLKEREAAGVHNLRYHADEKELEAWDNIEKKYDALEHKLGIRQSTYSEISPEFKFLRTISDKKNTSLDMDGLRGAFSRIREETTKHEWNTIRNMFLELSEKAGLTEVVKTLKSLPDRGGLYMTGPDGKKWN